MEKKEQIQYGKFLNQATGYDGLPELIEEKEFGNMLYEDDMHLYRGLHGKNIAETEKYVNQFKNGEYYAGQGVSGNGTYTATSYDYAMRYSNGISSGLLYIMPKESAKIIDIKKINWLRFAINKNIDFTNKGKIYEYFANTVLNDNGYLAEILGYDIVNLNEVKLVLNRTSVKVVK